MINNDQINIKKVKSYIKKIKTSKQKVKQFCKLFKGTLKIY